MNGTGNGQLKLLYVILGLATTLNVSAVGIIYGGLTREIADLQVSVAALTRISVTRDDIRHMIKTEAPWVAEREKVIDRQDTNTAAVVSLGARLAILERQSDVLQVKLDDILMRLVEMKKLLEKRRT